MQASLQARSPHGLRLRHGHSSRNRLACRAVAVKERVTLGSGNDALEFAPLINASEHAPTARNKPCNGSLQLIGRRDVGNSLVVTAERCLMIWRWGEAKLQAAAAAGYTSFDTADIYGPSEGILGQFSAAWSKAGGAPLQLFTKYVPNIFNQRPTPALVEAAIRRSLQNLQVAQLDLVQLHWWDYNIPGMVDTGLALADLKAKGLIKQVGATNMNVEAMAQLVDAGVPVANNQVQFSLLDRRPLNGMLQFCQQRSIKLFTYGSVGGGLLSDKYVEEPKQGLFGQTKHSNVDLNTSSLKMYWRIVKLAGGQEAWRQLLLVLRRVADKHNVSVANVALRWTMQQGDGASVFPIVGFRGASHLEDNARVLGLQLDDQDLAAIQEALQGMPGPEGDIYSFERSN